MSTIALLFEHEYPDTNEFFRAARLISKNFVKNKLKMRILLCVDVLEFLRGIRETNKSR